jgi:N,N-dimethylformamidase beta subunit-like, C-terminal/Concanavalin A-like lectin/glucanases superfamily/Bacterial Ig domain/Bacterial Ig-like domain
MSSSRNISIAALLAALVALAAPAIASAAPPTGVTGISLDGRVELAWQPAAGATDYAVYRGTSQGAITTKLNFGPTPPGGSPATTFTDLTPANGTTYFYAVRTVTSGVESANSRVVRAIPRARSCSTGNAVARENCFPGDTGWRLSGTPTLDGYATATSVNAGGSVGIKVNAPASFDIEIYRSGYYGGSGGRYISSILGVPASAQPSCLNDGTTGLVDCANWALSETVTTTPNWTSGAYLLRIVRNDTGSANHVLFVVRADQRNADVLYPLPFTTYQAYNNYGGRSLYDWNSNPPITASGANRAVKVSFDRPFAQTTVTSLNDWYTRTDFATVQWLERMGYDVSYASGTDLERTPAMARDHRVYLSGAHDEYISAGIRSAMTQARDAGTHLFFTGSNEVYWKVRFEASPVNGGQDRIMVCYKSTQSGGPDPSGIPTGTWRDPAGANQPENALTGQMYVGDNDTTPYPVVVTPTQGRDRVWRYTGLENSTSSTSIGTQYMSWEWDARVDNGFEPPGVTTLAASPASGQILRDAGKVYTAGSTVANATKYTAASGALVVSLGMNRWNLGLASAENRPAATDIRIQQATANILADMGSAPDTPMTGIRLDDPNGPPLVLARTPNSGATDVERSTPVRATFSRAMDAATLTSSTFTLKRTSDGATVPATVTYNAQTFIATLTPTTPLDYVTGYTARIDGSVKAANGIALGSAVTWSYTTATADTSAPSVVLDSPQEGAIVSGIVDLRASAGDDRGVTGVQFQIDGSDFGAPDEAPPYSTTWDVRGLSAGTHRITAIASDAAGNRTTSNGATVRVDPSGLVGAYGFDEASGTTVSDVSLQHNTGTITGATRTAAGKFGGALSFSGTGNWVTVPDADSLDLTTAMTLEAWVNPSVGTGWRTVIFKEQPNNFTYALYGTDDQGHPSGWLHSNVDYDMAGTGTVPTGAWTHLAMTYDGSAMRLYVNGTQVASRAVPPPIATSTGVLRIGGNNIWSEWFQGLIDEVRIYRRVLTPAEIGQDMTRPVLVDTQAPTTPGNFTATGALGEARLSWTASTDDNGVAKYNVYRSSTSGFTPSAANEIAEVTSGTSYTDRSAAAGTWYYRVTAEDAAGNASAPTAQAAATVLADTTAPTVSISAPAAGATVSGSHTVTATASDDVGVAGVQFRLDGNDLGAEDTSSPYSLSWDTTAVANGTHVLSAVARDGAGNRATSANVSVTVTNTAPDTSGLVAAYGFEEPSGTTVTDSSTRANNGTYANATRSTSGRHGSALSFNGTNASVTVPDAASLRLTTGMTLEAWVNPSAGGNWRTVLLKQQTNDLVYGLYSNDDVNRPSAWLYTTTSQPSVTGTAAVAVNTWTHLAATYDGTTVRMYVNGTQTGSRAISGALAAGTGPLKIGGNALWGEYFAGLIDDVRVYNRALSAGELQQDMNLAVAPAVQDTQAPTVPQNVSATGAIGQATVSWSASTDNVGVARYDVYRGTTTGFTPSAANRIAQVTSGTSYVDRSAAPGNAFYRVAAVDAAGNASAPSAEAMATVLADTTSPTVSVTAPAAGATVSGDVTLTANANDDVGVAGVQFRVDGADVASEDTAAPYSVTWSTAGVPNGTHTVTAVARDGAGNRTTSATVSVTLNNAPPDASGLVAAYGFEETTGTSVTDASSTGNTGTITGATRSTSGRFGRALSFTANSQYVTIPDANSLDLTTAFTLEAWVQPTNVSGWRTVLLKEQPGDLVYGLYSSTDNNRPSAVAFTGGVGRELKGPATLTNNAWAHLATTWDGATLRLYVNGTQVSTMALTGTMPVSTGPLKIGGNAVWPEWYRGLIDEVRVYRRALTAAEVAGDMNRAVVGG